MGTGTSSGIVRTHNLLAQSGGIQLIEKKDKSTHQTPSLAAQPFSIYATVTDDGKPNQITVYGEDGKKLYDIDLTHDHSKDKSYPDGHVQYYINGKRETDYHHPNEDQKEIIKDFQELLEKEKKKGNYYGR